MYLVKYAQYINMIEIRIAYFNTLLFMLLINYTYIQKMHIYKVLQVLSDP
jgi:hypothetical protein